MRQRHALPSKATWAFCRTRCSRRCYPPRLRARERRHPKLYWVDPGLARAAKRQLGQVGAEERGPLLEGWILTVLHAHNQGSKLFDEVAYWAPLEARQTEVDFLLRRGREHLALEVKAQARFSTAQLSGLRRLPKNVGRTQGRTPICPSGVQPTA